MAASMFILLYPASGAIQAAPSLINPDALATCASFSDHSTFHHMLRILKVTCSCTCFFRWYHMIQATTIICSHPSSGLVESMKWNQSSNTASDFFEINYMPCWRQTFLTWEQWNGMWATVSSCTPHRGHMGSSCICHRTNSLLTCRHLLKTRYINILVFFSTCAPQIVLQIFLSELVTSSLSRDCKRWYLLRTVYSLNDLNFQVKVSPLSNMLGWIASTRSTSGGINQPSITADLHVPAARSRKSETQSISPPAGIGHTGCSGAAPGSHTSSHARTLLPVPILYLTPCTRTFLRSKILRHVNDGLLPNYTWKKSGFVNKRHPCFASMALLKSCSLLKPSPPPFFIFAQISPFGPHNSRSNPYVSPPKFVHLTLELLTHTRVIKKTDMV